MSKVAGLHDRDHSCCDRWSATEASHSRTLILRPVTRSPLHEPTETICACGHALSEHIDGECFATSGVRTGVRQCYCSSRITPAAKPFLPTSVDEPASSLSGSTFKTRTSTDRKPWGLISWATRRMARANLSALVEGRHHNREEQATFDDVVATAIGKNPDDPAALLAGIQAGFWAIFGPGPDVTFTTGELLDAASKMARRMPHRAEDIRPSQRRALIEAALPAVWAKLIEAEENHNRCDNRAAVLGIMEANLALVSLAEQLGAQKYDEALDVDVPEEFGLAWAPSQLQSMRHGLRARELEA